MFGIFKRSKSKSVSSNFEESSTKSNGHNRKSLIGNKSQKQEKGMDQQSTESAAVKKPRIDSVMAAPKPPNPQSDPVGYLRTLNAVRERSALVMEKARKNDLLHFDVDWDKLDETVMVVMGIIKRDYAPDYSQIPAHGRWQHFDVGGKPRVKQLLDGWPTSQVDTHERTRRLLDLFVVSVLLDAGAGTVWKYTSKENGKSYSRSEGLAVASLEMFKAGVFSSDPAKKPTQVDAYGLQKLSVETMAKGLQVSPENPIEGLEGRTGLLQRLGEALVNEEYFGATHRPGNMLDYLLAHPTTQAVGAPIIQVPTLWNVLMLGLGPIWPSSRVQINGESIGDAWPCKSMPQPPAEPWESIVPFHKLSQWLAYSLMQPITRLTGAAFSHIEIMTGLPEYRNGGLLMDTGLLTLKKADLERGEAIFKENAGKNGSQTQEVTPSFTPDDDVIVEWRALTVHFLDEIHKKVNEKFSKEGFKEGLSLAQVLEAGTWKGGREMAEVSRPNTRCPPIIIISDGTVF